MFFNTCQMCEGLGWVPVGPIDTAECPLCHGDGQVTQAEVDAYHDFVEYDTRTPIPSDDDDEFSEDDYLGDFYL